MPEKNMPVQAGKQYQIEIAGLGHSGEGVGRYQDFTVFVPYALPGETVTAIVTEVKKNYAKAQLEKVIHPSAHRVEPPCSTYLACGGCQLQHLGYPAQLVQKRQTVEEAIKRIGKLPDVVIHPTIGAADPWYYRNKMQFPVGTAGEKVVIGCYAQGTHTVIDSEHCQIQHLTNNRIAATVRGILEDLKLPVYDEIRQTGLIRHVLGRVGVATGEVMTVIVTARPQLPQTDKIVHRLRQAIPGLVSVIQNINPRQTNVILGETNKTLWGKDTIIDRLGDFSFRISARSFFQVNTKQAEILYNQAVQYAGLTGQETVLDVYCGTGTITLFLAKHSKKVYGIEVVEPAIIDARQNAKENGVTNTEFIVGDANVVIPHLSRQGVRPEVIVVDPPRAGCERSVLETFARMQPDRMVYVSCNPASLARDLAILAEHGYQAREIQPVDMFPQTYHVETVVLLSRVID